MEILNRKPALRFAGFSGDWKEKKLGEISEIIGGGTPETSKEEYWNGNIQWFTPTEIKYNFVSKSNRTITELGLKKSSAKLLPKGAILLTTRATIGEVSIALEICTTNQGFQSFIVNENINNIFVFNWLKQNKDELLKRATGSTFPEISKSKLQQLDIVIPCLAEQQKIAHFFSAIDEKLSQLKKKQNLLQQYKKGVMQQLFSQKLRFKDDEGNDFEDWKEMKLNEFLIPTLREVNKPTTPYLAIGIKSHCKGTFQKPDTDPEKNEMDKLFKVQENDLIVNITFAWEGAIAIVKKEDTGGLVSHRFPTYTFHRNKTIHEYFKYVFIQKEFVAILDLISPGGAGRNRVLSKNEFLKIKWKFPNVAEQQKIATFLSAIDEKITCVSKAIKQLESWKKGLLQQMFV